MPRLVTRMTGMLPATAASAAIEAGIEIPTPCANPCRKNPAIENTPSARMIRIRSGRRPALIHRNRPPNPLPLSESTATSLPTNSLIEKPTSVASNSMPPSAIMIAAATAKGRTSGASRRSVRALIAAT